MANQTCRGPDPLSAKSRRRLLDSLYHRAEGGDVAAAESLIRLSLLNERVKKAPAAADQLLAADQSLFGGGAVA